MKRFMLFLALGLAATEKLDRTYLPPPGSKYAGGEPGDLQVPLEFPKQAYTTTAPSLAGQNNEPSTFGGTQLIPGSFRRPAQDFLGTTSVTPSSKLPFNYFQTKVPTTTTSYAFTQTTTFPPNEGYETTISPILPVETPLGESPGLIKPFGQEQIFNQNIPQNRPILPQTSNQLSQRPGFLPISNISGVQTSYPGSQSAEQGINPIPVSTASPVLGTLQPGLVTSLPNNQGYTQHLGVQPPRQFNQQGYFPSSSTAPGYQTGFPSQNGDISKIQTPNVVGQQPTGYPSHSPQQSTTQYIDKYGNVQNNVVPGFTPQTQQSQSALPQPGLTQYGENLNSISRTPGLLTPSQQGVNNLDTIGSVIPHTGSQKASDTGLMYGQQQGVPRPQYFEQNGPFPTSVPGMSGTQQKGDLQLFGQQRPVSPTTSPGGILSDQGYQYPKFGNQQGNLPSTGFSQSSPITGSPINPFQQNQRPEFSTQRNIYPSTGISQVNPETVFQPQSGGQVPGPQLGGQLPGQQLGGQQNLRPSTLIPGQSGTNLPGARPQFIEQQGAIPTNLPGQSYYQQPESQNSQIGQQNSFPSAGSSQTTSFPTQQTNVQQTGLNPQSYQTNGLVTNLPTKPDVYLNNIPLRPNQPGQEQSVDFSGSRPTPFGQPQTDNRIPSSQKPGQRIITNGPFNINRPSTASVPSGYQQPSFTSTTPSSIPSYSITPGSTIAPRPVINIEGTNQGTLTSRPELPQAESDRNAIILNYENVLTPEGFAYTFDTSNGIHADQNGTAIDGVKADGSYSYIGDDGKLYSVVYTADENGFIPHGDHLPTPPPVPKAIQQVIEQASKDKQAGISHDGFYDEQKYGHKKYQFSKHRRPQMQDKITDDANTDTGYERKFNKKIRPDEERTNETYGKNYDTEYDTGDSNFGMNKHNDQNQDKIGKKNISRRPIYKKPGQNDYGAEQTQHSVTDEQPQQKFVEPGSKRRKPIQGKISHKPGTFSHKVKPVSSRDEYDDDQHYGDVKEKEEYDNGDDTKIPTKATATTFSDSQQTDYDKPQFSGSVDSKEPSGGVIRRPGTKTSENSYKLKQKSKGTRPQKPVKNFATKSQVSDDGSVDQENYQEPNIFDQENPNNEENYPTSSKSEQKSQTLYHQPLNKNVNKNIPQQPDDEETGYEYTPPQNKLYHGEKNRFPSRFSDKISTKKPDNMYKTVDDNTTVQPFITPNVHRDEDGNYEDESEEDDRSQNSRKMTSSLPGYKNTEDSSEYSDEQSEPDQGFDREGEDSSKTYPGKSRKPTLIYRPGYDSQRTTGKPAYYDEITTGKGGKMRRPGSASDQYSNDLQKQRTQQPDEDYTEETIQKSKSPSFTYTSSTTPMTIKKPHRPIYKQTPPQTQEHYSTTYEPSDTSSAEEDFYETTNRPGYSSSKFRPSRPGTSFGTMPNTTLSIGSDRPGASRTEIISSRPTYDYSSDRTMIPESPTIQPGTSKSIAGKTVVTPGDLRQPNYYTTTLQTTGPDYSDDYDRNSPETRPFYSTTKDGTKYPEKTLKGPVTPGINIYQNLGQPGRKDVPSTTYRPNYSITSISEPNSAAVDTFGRPLQPVSGTKSIQPGIPVTSSQGTLSNVYQDTGITRPRPGSFRPSEPRFGSPQGIPGQKPVEFGPSSFTTPGYLSPYEPSTTKIIGEDFSGPKQQQKYDPETGYYY